jgi:serine phosphatase RsbU (regulator of sigma subunit)
MLPRQLPDLPNVQLATRYLAGSTGTEVGGDWYDAFEINSGQIGLAVGDVIGKGMHAAATMGQLRNALRIFGLEGLEPQQAVGRLNELTNSPESAFATVVYATFDPGSRLLSYTCAGHPPPLCVTTTGAVRYLAEGRGLPLGADEATQYEQANATLSPGDLLILYTDGLVENRRDSLDARLIRLASIPTTGAADLDHLLDNILYEMAEAEHFTDDVAILALRT